MAGSNPEELDDPLESWATPDAARKAASSLTGDRERGRFIT
jgi:hypothetical protein